MFWRSKHPSLEWAVWLQKHPFARFCKDIKIVHISKISPFCWAKLEKTRFLCFYIYEINCPIRAKILLNLTSEGLKFLPEVGVEHKHVGSRTPEPEVSENSRRESASFFLARPWEMIFSSLNLVSKHESNKMESRSRLEIREWSYDNLDLVSPGESKKNNSQSRLEKLHLLSRVRVIF